MNKAMLLCPPTVRPRPAPCAQGTGNNARWVGEPGLTRIDPGIWGLSGPETRVGLSHLPCSFPGQGDQKVWGH